MSYSSTYTVQKAAEMVMFGALCIAAADIVWSRVESRPLPPAPVTLTSVAAAAAPPAPPAPPAVQQVLAQQPRIAPPVPPAPPAPVAAARPAVAPARPAVAAEPLPVLAGTLVGRGVYLAVIQSGTGTRVVRTGDRVGAYIVNWVGPYKACVKDAQGKKHVLALGVGGPSSPTATRPTVPYIAPPRPVVSYDNPSTAGSSSASRVAFNSAPPPPPPPPSMANGRGFSVNPPR